MNYLHSPRVANCTLIKRDGHLTIQTVTRRGGVCGDHLPKASGTYASHDNTSSHLAMKRQVRCIRKVPVIGFSEALDSLGAQAGALGDLGPMSPVSHEPLTDQSDVVHASILDTKDQNSKSQMSRAWTYSSGMATGKEFLANRVEAMIGPDKEFRSAREMAQRAQTLGYVSSAESLTRNINRIRNCEVDPQLSTLEAIAGAVGIDVADLFTTTPNLSREITEAIRLLHDANSLTQIKRELLLNTIKLVVAEDEPARLEKMRSK